MRPFPSNTPLRVLALAASFAAASTCGLIAAGCSAPASESQPSVHASPFLEKFGFDPFTGQWSDAEREQLVAACMRYRGFAYLPKKTKAVPVFGTGSRDRVKSEGYGVTTGYDGSDKGGDRDPNDDVIAALSVAQRSAYYRALIGSDPSAGGEGFAPGCVQQAQIELYGFATKFPSPLQLLVDRFVAAVATDPEVEGVKTLWRQCLAKAGYSVSTRDGIVTDIETRRDTLLYGSAGTIVAGSGSTTSAEFRALQRDEREIALADFDCDSSVGLTKAQQSALDHVQLAYLEEHPGFNLRELGS